MFPHFWLDDPLFMRRWVGPRDHTPHKSSKAGVGKKELKLVKLIKQPQNKENRIINSKNN